MAVAPMASCAGRQFHREPAEDCCLAGGRQKMVMGLSGFEADAVRCRFIDCGYPGGAVNGTAGSENGGFPNGQWGEEAAAELDSFF